jgi:hypothetical protein
MKKIILPIAAAVTQSNYMKPFFITLVMLQLGFASFAPVRLTAQVNTFSFLYEAPENKGSYIPIEDDDGNLIVPVRILTGAAYGPSAPDWSFLLKFSPTGDTSSNYYSIPDTAFSFIHILNTIDGGYLVTGSSKAIGMDSVNLLLVKLNYGLEVEWIKQHYIYGNFIISIENIFPMDDHGFMLLGMVCMFPCSHQYPYLARIDQNGNMVRETIYENFSGFPYEYMLNPAKNRIWMFAVGLPPHTNGRSVTIMDTTFAFIRTLQLTVCYNAKLNDTSFIYTYQIGKVGLPYEDMEFTIEIRDTLFNLPI